MNKQRLRIVSPCTADWSQMTGDDQRRFCDLCQRSVLNLSAMRETQAQALLDQRTPGQRLCVRYAARPDGTVRFQPPTARRTWRGAALATAAIASLSLASPTAQAALAGSNKGQEQASEETEAPRTGPLRRLGRRLQRWLRPPAPIPVEDAGEWMGMYIDVEEEEEEAEAEEQGVRPAR